MKIKFDAKAHAEEVLTKTMKRQRFTFADRDALAAHLEQIVLQVFRDAGMNVVNTHSDNSY